MNWRKIGVKSYKLNRGRYFNALKDHFETTSYTRVWGKNSTLVLDEVDTQFQDFLLRLLAEPWRIHFRNTFENTFLILSPPRFISFK